MVITESRRGKPRLLFLWVLSAALALPVFYAPAQELGIPPGREPGAFLHYGNDVAFGTDRYFTQGLALEYCSPALSLIRRDSSHGALRLEQDVFTPSSIRDSSRRPGDHPYAATLSLCYTQVLKMHTGILRLSLSGGILGPAAGGEQMQTSIHKITGDVIPAGWKYQIQPALLIDAAAEYQYRLIRHRAVDISAIGIAEAGTGKIRASAGVAAELLLLQGKNTRLKFYARSLIRYAPYQAVLQGSLLNSDEADLLQPEDLRPLGGFLLAGAELQTGQLHLSFWVQAITAPFRGAASHRIGGISIGYLSKQK
jgi:lipid A 3-O-deacylase